MSVLAASAVLTLEEVRARGHHCVKIALKARMALLGWSECRRVRILAEKLSSTERKVVCWIGGSHTRDDGECKEEKDDKLKKEGEKEEDWDQGEEMGDQVRRVREQEVPMEQVMEQQQRLAEGKVLVEPSGIAMLDK
eukprot:765833-Hanusia_phi.AAC.2